MDTDAARGPVQIGSAPFGAPLGNLPHRAPRARETKATHNLQSLRF